MKKHDVTNLPASVHDRLLKIAKERGTEFQDLLINYALARWLYRMTQSSHQDRFVLKGAMLFAIRSSRPAIARLSAQDHLRQLKKESASLGAPASSRAG